MDSYCHWVARMEVAKRVLAFDSLCTARTGVAKHVLTFDSLCRARTGVTKHVLTFDSLCRARTGVAKHVLTFDSLCGVRTGVANHVLLRAVKDWVLCILNIIIEYFLCRFLGHVVLILLLDVKYTSISFNLMWLI